MRRKELIPSAAAMAATGVLIGTMTASKGVTPALVTAWAVWAVGVAALAVTARLARA